MLIFPAMSLTGPQIFVSSGLDRRLVWGGMEKYKTFKGLVIPNKEKESNLPRQSHSENLCLFESLLLSLSLHCFMLDSFSLMDPTALSVR